MISVIGAGPAGSYVSYLLSKNGYSVNLFEEDKVIGKPVHCTGIVTKNITQFFKNHELSEFTINKIDTIKIVSPDSKEITIPTKEYVFDRAKFDVFLSEKAVSSGAKMFTGHKYVRHDDQFAHFQNNKKISYTELIGADGPQSSVSKNIHQYGNRKFYVGIQARVKGNYSPNEYAVYFDNFKFPCFFGWVVPESETVARLGLASKNNASTHFQNFLKQLHVEKNKITEHQGGLIPIYDKTVIPQNKNVFLLGDAATHVKATTGGGIIQGLIGSRCLVESIIEDKKYPSLLRKKLYPELSMHLRIRKMLDTFSNEDYDYLTSLFSQPRIKKTLHSTSRDNVVSLGLKLLIKEPRFLHFLKKI